MVAFDPLDEGSEYRIDPYPLYRRLRDEDPAHYSEKYDTWFLSRFRDIWSVEQLTDSLTMVDGQMPLQVMGVEQIAFLEGFEDGLASIDPPRHTQIRGLLSPRFRPSAAARLEAMCRETVRGFVDEFIERGEADIIADFAMRTSVRIACTIIGLPLEMADWCAQRVNAVFDRDAQGTNPSADSQAGIVEMHEWLFEVMDERQKNPTDDDDALNALLRASPGDKPLNPAGVLANVSLMLIGGTETLPKALSAAVYRLAEHPDQRAELVADPKLIPHAFTEALRYDMPTQMLGRRVTREIEIHGKTMKPGQGLLFLWASANRDEREFPEPERFDIHRRARRILTFGSGAHMCLGAHVARMEGKVMLEELLARIPVYEVDESRIERVRSEVFRGFARLPIRFPAGGGAA